MNGFRTLLALLAVLFSSQAISQELKAYQLFDAQGNPTHFQELAHQSAQAEAVLFGELHNNPISHWLQLELTRELFNRKGESLVMGAEMFEADNQLLLDEYFSGLIGERNFLAEARLWNNYATDIKPLVEFARENNIRFVATNIPRRYAALVNREGFEGLEKLSQTAQAWIAPLPVAYDPDLPGYKAMLEMGGMPGHTNENFPRAQAIKDATMAHFMLQNFSEGNIFIHFHGTYHSNNYEGIVWYLQKEKPALRILTIATVEQEHVEELEEEYKGLADFILAVPARMTKTY